MPNANTDLHVSSPSEASGRSVDTPRQANPLRKIPRLENRGSVSELVTIELCAGSAAYSATLKALGFQVIPIDHRFNEHQQKTRCVVIDLSADDAWDLVEKILDSGHVHSVHLGPPCGTASAARNRPIPFALRAQGAPCPPPLRSEQYPLGLPHLTKTQLRRVVTANKIYWLCSKVIQKCILLRIIVSMENPLNSLLWLVPWIAALLQLPELEFIVLDNCMFGSSRNKSSAFLCTKGVFSSMAVRCDRKHTHRQWQLKWTEGKWKFDTAEEAEYTKELCDALAACVLAAAVAKNYVPLPLEVGDDMNEVQKRLWLRATTGKLPRGRRLPQIVSEFASVEEWDEHRGPLNKNNRLIRQFHRKGVNSGSDELIRIVGTWRSPQDYIHKALEVEHPTDSTSAIPDIIRNAVFKILTLGPSLLVKTRIVELQVIQRMAADCKQENDQMLQQVSENNRPILATKNIALLDKLIRETGYQDTDLCADILRGFDVVGKTNRSNVLPSKLVVATMSAKELKQNSSWTRKVTLAKCRASGDVELDKEVYEQTVEQRRMKWIRGPYAETQIQHMFPDGWVPICRFGLRQSNKIRVIDECRGPAINFALSTCEKLQLMDIDDYVAITKFVYRSTDHGSREVLVELSDKTELRGHLHSDWGAPESMNWQGRTLDLRDAYKNLANSDETKFAAVLATYNPNMDMVELDVSDVLMFGSTAAVYAFNRVARTIWHIATVKLGIVITQFYDDYPGLEPEKTSCTARSAFQALLSILGWRWADGNKNPPFQHTFSQLGVLVDLRQLPLGKTIIQNKPSRVEAVSAEIDMHLEKSELSYSSAAELHGKLQYCESQCFGRVAVPALRILRERADSKSNYKKLNADLEWALRFLKEHLRTSKPRVITACVSEKAIVIFTDGSSEGEKHLWGIVVFGLTARPLVAGGSVDERLVKTWKSEQSQIINQVELYPVILLREHLGAALDGRKLLYFIDNDAAKDSLVKADSDSRWTTKLIRKFYDQERRYPSFPWFSRVPSYSNPADLPSRGGVLEAAKLLIADVFEPKQLEQSVVDELVS